jgi:hypothetical protein
MMKQLPNGTILLFHHLSISILVRKEFPRGVAVDWILFGSLNIRNLLPFIGESSSRLFHHWCSQLHNTIAKQP